MGTDPDRGGQRRGERSVAVTQQQVHGSRAADDRKVEFPVAVEVSGLGVERVSSGAVIDVWLERAVAVAEHDAHGAREGVVDNGDVGLAVPVEVTHREGRGGGAGGVADRR